MSARSRGTELWGPYLVPTTLAVVADATSRAGLHCDTVANLEVANLRSNCAEGSVLWSPVRRVNHVLTLRDDTRRLMTKDLEDRMLVNDMNTNKYTTNMTYHGFLYDELADAAGNEVVDVRSADTWMQPMSSERGEICHSQADTHQSS